MSWLKSVGVPGRAYELMLWTLSVVFAVFIVGLGNLIIGDLPQVEEPVRLEQFHDSERSAALLSGLGDIVERRGAIETRLEIVRLQLEQAQTLSKTATESFEAWIKTRSVTTDPRQDPELLERTREIEQLKTNERALQTTIADLENRQLTITSRESELRVQLSNLDQQSFPAYQRALFWQELRIFTLRLLVALPMLLLAVWLVLKKRDSDHWPLMRGFVLASVFVFFVELVPYLPSYGGYVRYAVGILLTVAAGHFLVRHMRAYLDRRAATERQAETERRRLLSHEEALRKMAAKQCPGCDRSITAMEGDRPNFCVHCGMTLHDRCTSCDHRKVAFYRYCMECGAPAQEVSPSTQG